MKKWFVLLFIAAMMISMIACGSAEQQVSSKPEATSGDEQHVEQETEQTMNVEGQTEVEGQNEEGQENADEVDKTTTTTYPLTVIDATGTEVVIEKEPERIVSTSPSETEILFHLGLGEKVVAVTDFCDYPLEATTKPKVGGVSAPNEEAIIAAEPDLVIGGVSMKDDVAEKLRQYHLTLYKAEPKNLDDVFAHILQIGLITNTQEEAQQLVDKLMGDVRTVTDAVSSITDDERKTVYIEYNPGWTVGKGEFMDELISLAGAVNIAADTEGWVRIDEEKIIQDNPDTILYTAHKVDKASGKTIDELIKSRSGWDTITAVREGQLMPIEESVVSRTGPRITEGLLQIAKSVYPELFQ